MTLAHRASWTMTYGPIPKGLTVDHRVCRVKLCVNRSAAEETSGTIDRAGRHFHGMRPPPPPRGQAKGRAGSSTPYM